MRSNAVMANRQGDVDLRFVHVSTPQLTLWIALVLPSYHSQHLPVKMEPMECPETSALNIQTVGKCPE
jgi:hypothetical protein